MVRDGFGDESGAKLIEQRGIDFAPAEDFMQSLKAAGASEAFLNALCAAKPPEPTSAKKPINQVQVMTLLAGQISSHRVAILVQERGIDFDAKGDYLQEVRLGGGDDELISALKSAKVTKPATVDPAAQARQAEVRRHVVRGTELAKKGQYAEAELEYRAALRLDSQNADIYMGLAYILGQEKKWDDTVSAAREALRLDPNDEIAHVNLGVALTWKADWDGAITEYHEALRLNPNNDMAHNNLGVALERKGDLDGAIAEYREALRLNPTNEDAHVNLGVALGNKGDWDGAITEYREALRLNPNNAMAHFDLGSALGNKADWDGEITEEREALRLNPNLAGAHVGLGAALGHKRDWDGMIAEYREALRLNPNDDMAHFGLGVALGGKHDWDGMITEAHEALRLNPKNAYAHFGLGTGLEGKGDRRGALEEYRAACTLDPKNAQFKQAYERLTQPLSPLAEATPTDISGEWKSLTSGTTFRVRLEQAHAYVERLVTEEQSKLGIFQLCDLGNEGDKYHGTCRSQWVDRWYDNRPWVHQWRTRVCQSQGQMDFTTYSPSRIEGRLETRGVGEKWSDRDQSNCGERFPLKWQDIVWIRPN
jgi:tetratricopeptide (TPR) repeat protein